jgi:hypothetical protein
MAEPPQPSQEPGEVLAYDTATGQLRPILGVAAPTSGTDKTPEIVTTSSNKPSSGWLRKPPWVEGAHRASLDRPQRPIVLPSGPPSEIPTQQMPSSDDQPLWRVTTAWAIWGCVAATVLGAGLFGFMENHLWYGVLYVGAGLIGLVFMTYCLLRGWRRPPPLPVAGVLLVMTWALFGTDLWVRYSAAITPPSTLPTRTSDPRDAVIASLQA